MTACYCCDRRPCPDDEGCVCPAVYCRRCLWCGFHCGCLAPLLVADEDTADDPAAVIEPAPQAASAAAIRGPGTAAG